MPERNALTGSEIDTGNLFQDAVDNVVQLINEHLSDLSTYDRNLISQNVVKYDEIKVFDTPFCAVVFEASRIVADRINKCVTIGIDISIYYYFQSLTFGNDTHPFLAPLWRLMEMFIVHFDLYGFTAGTANQVEITNTSLIGRRLESQAYLTGLVNLTLNRRHCRTGHS